MRAPGISRTAWVGVLLLAHALDPAAGATTQDWATVSAGGGCASNLALRVHTTVGNVEASWARSPGHFTLLGGFPGGLELAPGRDSDGDGIPDEQDPDNDADGLADLDELSGTAFQGLARTDACAADSDGDGMSDLEEARGLFDPWDPHHALKLIALSAPGGEVTLQWIGKGGGATNAVVSLDRLGGGSTPTVLDRRAYAGGDTPWFKTTNTFTDRDATTSRIYRVEIHP